MFLIKGPVADDRIDVQSIYDMSHPRNVDISTEGGLLVEAYPEPPHEDGFGCSVFYNVDTQQYEYEPYPLPEEPAIII